MGRGAWGHAPARALHVSLSPSACLRPRQGLYARSSGLGPSGRRPELVPRFARDETSKDAARPERSVGWHSPHEAIATAPFALSEVEGLRTPRNAWTR